MLEDRYYMRRPEYNTRRSAMLALLIANVVAFLLECAHYGYPPSFHYGDALLLSWNGLRHGYVWQLLTFQFLHANFLHLLFNALGIFFFGRELEVALGPKRFLALYFSSGVIGGLVQSLGGGLGVYLQNDWLARLGGPTLGASAGVFGLIAAYAMMFPDRYIYIYFVLPIRARFLLIFEAVYVVFRLAFTESNVAEAAHLGGMVTGILFVRYAMNWEWHWPQLNRVRRAQPRRLVKVPSGTSAQWRRSRTTSADLPPEEFLSKEVDPILDKISAQGIQSLTERERRILETARERMSRR